MSYQLVSTSDVTGDIEADLEALLLRVNALVDEGYKPLGGPVVRKNPEVGDYFIQAMFKPVPATFKKKRNVDPSMPLKKEASDKGPPKILPGSY